MKFIGREKEIISINEKLNSSKSECIVLYGRRRLGKTTLLKEVLKNKTNYSYHVFLEENLKVNLRIFKSILAEQLQISLLKQIQAETFVEYFNNIKEILPNNSIICLDEFPYLIKQSRGIISQFQVIYDEYLKPKNCKLILCGSSISMMSDIMSYQSPLYGRRTLSIHLKELNFYEIKEMLYNIKDSVELLKYVGIFGGVPYYLEQINQERSFEENFKKLFFDGQSFFFDEVSFLLKEEVREIRNYTSILKAIALGKNTFTQIEQFSLIERSSLAKYLDVLQSLYIIENYKSFFDKLNSKKTRYRINDNFIDFYFNIIDKNKSFLFNEAKKKEILQIDLMNFMGRAFEKICKSILFFKYENIGTYFKKDIEIDILGKNEGVIDLFECKFKKNIDEKKELKKLEKKIEYLPEEYIYNCNIISLENFNNYLK